MSQLFDTTATQDDTRTYPDEHGPDEPTIYATPPMKIGKHEWRCLVYQNKHYGRCTHYEFRGPNAPYDRPAWAWNCAQTYWPTYDGDRHDGGLPAGIRRLYERHERNIRAALAT